MKFVRDNLDEVRTMLKNRNNALNLDNFNELEQKRRAILGETEQLKSQHNATSKHIGAMKKAGENTDAISAEFGAKGSSGMIELGWQMKPSKNSAVMLDSALVGWVGKQKGLSFQIKLKKDF